MYDQGTFVDDKTVCVPLREPIPTPVTDLGRVQRRDVLGGLIHEYKAAA
jgi:hypothetical protein